MIELPQQQTRYVIIDDDNGVFLGTYTMADFQVEEDFFEGHEDANLDKSFALFAKDNPFSIHRACSFETAEEAKRFIKDSFGVKASELSLKTAPVKCSSYYPDVVDLVKSGYGDYTYDMLDGLESPSEKMH